ncbi:MAG: gliding motility-associated protein GldE [Bacteroidales bacterium]|nr:gliding motility-associated protein GldE [Bacteroidales bacterium]
METITDFFISLNSLISFNAPDLNSLIEIVFFILLILLSALISGSEVAYFSLTPRIIHSLENSTSKADKKVLKLIREPDRLLATILITNNFVNIAIVVLATYITASLINFGEVLWLKFVVEAVVVTFIILLFGEIIPKIYANRYNKSFALIMSVPLTAFGKILYPFATILVKSTNIVNKRIQGTNALSMSDLSHAIDITSGPTQNEKKILKRVVNFSNIEVREIMTPRVDVVTLNKNYKLSVLKKIITESGFSRIPVYEDELDSIVGVLYIKDLIKYLNKDNYFEWQNYIRPAYFVPENKKIDDLLQEFRAKKIHLAIVSDEYGGFSGIVSLEDTIEEIVGEINDEFDIPENLFSKISDNQFLMDGKLLMKDFQRMVNLTDNFFDEVKGDAETIAGLILEILGDFPAINQKITYSNIEFKIISLNNRRIEKVKITITDKQ